ncbi:MAG: hypothetical protein U9R79_04595 [Armatimonadota bacterium]|nr:hypothetical protein [Armatimonadota bacterium]
MALIVLSGRLLHAQEDDPLAWIDSERIRAAYFYARPPAEEKTQQLVDVGMNAMILKAGIERAMPYLREARRHQGMHTFLALNFNVNAEEEGLRRAVLADGTVERYACPLEERFWREHLLPGMLERAELAADPELQVDGLWIDFELYSTITGQRYYTNACYCDHCFGEFCRSKGIEMPDLDYAHRRPWLEEQGYTEEYQPFLGTRVEGLAREVREQVHEMAPNLLLGFYPTPHNWSLEAVARAFSTQRLPIILWATDTYGGGGPDRVPDDWREHYEELGVNARYCAGMLLRRYSAKNLAAYIYHTSAECDGYWLFTAYTLWTPPEERSGDYYLAAGTAEQYWQAMERGNEELDRLAADPRHETELEIGIEPIIYHPLAKPEMRRRVERLVPPGVTGEPAEYPIVWLRGPNLMVVACEAGRPVEIELRLGQIGEGSDRITWEATTRDGTLVASEKGGAGEDVTVRFTPEQDGIHYLLASASSSRYAPLRSTAPLGLYAARLHIMSGAERLYFRVPEGVEEFTILAEGSSGHETVRVEVYAADGELAAAAESNAEDTEAPVEVQALGHHGETWSLALTRADVGILEDLYLTLPDPLPPVVSLSPEHVFGIRPAEE